MSAIHENARRLGLLAVALTMLTPREAYSVQLSTVVTNIQQSGLSGGVMLGHAAIGSTNYNRIVVSAGYIAQCASSLMLPTSGDRTLSRNEFVGGATLTTTVPERIPALVFMPGFEQVAPGTVLSCTYEWNSKAVESGYTIGAGISFPAGAGEQSLGSTVRFVMIVPRGSDDSDDGNACIP
jgi:hypothetical protein